MHRRLSLCAAIAAFACVATPDPTAAGDLEVAFLHAPEPARSAPAARYLGDPRQLSKWARIADAIDRAVAPVAGPTVVAAVSVPPVALPTVAAVNRRINATPYRSDSENWGVGDLWATPAEFARRGGDCEDYAIAKYVALRQAGVPASALWIEVGYDHARADYHAALTVELDGGAWLLDMDVARPIPRAEHRSLETIYTINEIGLWVRG